MREKTLIKNTFIISFGKIFTQLITFLLLPIYTSILSIEEYGIVDILSTLTSLLLPIVTLQIEQAMFRNLIEIRDDEKRKTEVISTGLISVFLQVLLFLILFMIVSPLIKNNYKWYLLINVITYIFLSLLQQIARGLGNNKKYSIGSFISAIFTIIFNIIFIVVVRLGAYGMLLGTILGQLCGILYFYTSLKLFNYVHIRSYKKIIFKDLVKYSIPLIPNAISWWIFNASDRVIATSILGVEQNGILAASLKFSAMYITLYNMFNLSWTESISMSINDKDIENYFNKTFNVIISIFASLSIVIIAFMPFIYPIIINEKFSSGYLLVPISIIASLFNVIVGLISVIYVGKKNTKAIANTSIISAVLNIIIHLLLIKFIGLFAAVVSTFFAFFIMSIYRILDIRKKYFKIKMDKKIILTIIILIPLTLVSYYINNLYLNIIMATFSLIFAYILNKNSLNQIFIFLKNYKRKGGTS